MKKRHRQRRGNHAMMETGHSGAVTPRSLYSKPGHRYGMASLNQIELTVKTNYHGLGVAQWVKCLLYKREDLGLIPRAYISQLWMHGLTMPLLGR